MLLLLFKLLYTNLKGKNDDKKNKYKFKINEEQKERSRF